MNLFELYEMPIRLTVDRDQVTKKYHSLSRTYHPDLHTSSSTSRQEDILQMASQVNRAYKTFLHPDEIIKYVLQLKGLLHEEEKYDLDPEFLGEMLEINEVLMELSMESNNEKLDAVELQTKELIKTTHEDVATIIENYTEGVTTEKELLQVKEYYYRKKYLQRILDKIAQLRNIAAL
ncbi:MAG TPA: Fe-S protein assembly co-chaperone HscB [Flavitalea sp.]|nr:Fe-S protein assembly co-chaperone HscB [Flavitalea sp.]